ncbi:YrdB family protein [Sphaerisporangium krabiense]|uniref:DUF2568 domain-containing protein n=1 Tax=Sphaerisporangium krabiense TaxID=763782 RepID=A0A7W9DRN1_9ACTN|nr:YrdB family protein [Sphaerisporangium krabiense]MBB5628822.1 hypothetical protein [Sphaerisporangium krabiense]
MGLMFVLELAVYLAVGYWGFTLGVAWPVGILVGLGAPVMFAVVWGLLGSPKARVPLRGPSRAVLEVLWFGGGVAAAAAAGLTTASLVFAAAFAVNAALRVAWAQVA